MTNLVNQMSTADAQCHLQNLGYYTGAIDGIAGPKTDRAISRFKEHIGFNPRPWIGPKTAQALIDHKNSLIVPGDPLWLKYASTFDGMKEIRGRMHNKEIVSWWIQQKMPFRDDETPWCAAYVNHIFDECNIPNPGKANARSYTKWGKKINKPIRGSVVVYWRGNPNGWSGHVGFVMGEDQNGNIMTLGGNQGNQVNVKPFDTDRVLGYYWVDNSEIPDYQKFLLSSNGQLSTNEA